MERDEPDLAPAPTAPGRTAERLWRFEWPDPGEIPVGRCATCGGRHVPDRETLDRLLRALQLDGADLLPCSCPCCVAALG